MPKGLTQDVRNHLEKCRSAAIAAVDVYNRPGPRFRTAHYIVLIVIAWTALFHAICYKKRIKPCYKNKTGKRYLKLPSGEPKYWDLMECLKHFHGANHPPERKNLEFLIELRNKIEHRYLPALDSPLYGECQAALLNLEEYLTKEFGEKYGLSEQLAISLQFSSLMPSEKRHAAKQLASKAAKTVKAYVEKFRGDLPEATLNSNRYSFSVYLVPKVANRANLADSVVEFFKIDDAKPEEMQRLQKLNVLIKEKNIPIANLDLIRPHDVVTKVNGKLAGMPGPPVPINIALHTKAWKYFNVRPLSGAAKPEATQAQYCAFDEAHDDYLYTNAWVDKLVSEFSDPARRALIS